MRYLILGFTLFLTGCTEYKQPATKSDSKIDTAKLFDPNPQKNKLLKTEEVLCNCLMLEKEKIAAGIRCEKMEVANDNELQVLLQKNAADIRKQKFYIVYSNNTTGKRIMDIIEIIKAKKIDDYRVISLQNLITLYVPKE